MQCNFKMDMQPTVTELYKNAERLGPKDLSRLLKKLTILLFKRSGANVLPDKEAVLLQELNKGFPTDKWTRLKELDQKMEFNEINEEEQTELLQLSKEYENVSLQRLKILTKLAELRNVSHDTLTTQLGIKPFPHA